MRHVLWVLLCFLLIGSLGFGVGVAVPLYRDSRHRDLSQYPSDDRQFIETFQLMAQLKWADERAALILEDKHRSADERRRVLQEALRSISEDEQSVHPPDLASLIKAQAGIVSLRGALFEESVGNSQAASSYLSKAQKYLQDAGWRDCSEVKLRAIMQHPSTGSSQPVSQ